MRSLIITLLVISAALLTSAISAADTDVDYVSTFISKLDKYVSWPDDKAAEGNGDLFVITAVGNGPLAQKLEELDYKKSGKGKQIKVRVVDIDFLPANAHVLVVDTEDVAVLETVARQLKGTSTLIVGNTDGFAEKGAMINFYSDSTSGEVKTKSEVNLDVAKAENLKINTALLKLARTVASR